MKRRFLQFMTALLVAGASIVPLASTTGADTLGCADIDGATILMGQKSYTIRWYFDRTSFNPVLCNGVQIVSKVELWSYPTKRGKPSTVTEAQAELLPSGPAVGSTTNDYPTAPMIETDQKSAAFGYPYVEAIVTTTDLAPTKVCFSAATDTTTRLFPDGEPSVTDTGADYTNGQLRACVTGSGGGNTWI